MLSAFASSREWTRHFSTRIATERPLGRDLLRGFIAKVGEQSYVLVGEWPDMNAIAASRSRMIGTLDTFRHTLEELGPGLGVTDAVSGETVLTLK